MLLWLNLKYNCTLNRNPFIPIRNLLSQQGGHKPGKPGILIAFSEHGKRREFCATSGKIVTNKVFLVRHSNICVKRLLTCYIAGVDGMTLVIITFTFCCDNLWKSKFVALEKPGKLREFFLLLCGHPVSVSAKWKSQYFGLQSGISLISYILNVINFAAA